MKRLTFVVLCLIFSLSAFAQTTFYIESRTDAGVITDSSLYLEAGAWYGSGSTAKSNAPAPELPGGVLQGAGSRFSDNAALDATFEMYIGNHGDFVSGTAYDIYITAPNASSIDAANSTYVVFDTANPEGTPLDSGTIAITQVNCGDTWALVASNITLGAGATIKIGEAAPQVNRFYADAIKIVPYSAGPTPTPTPPPTPWPTPYQPFDNVLVEQVDNASDTDNPTDTFAITPIVSDGGSLFAWFYVADGTGAVNNDFWYRDQRVISVDVADITATSEWIIQSVPAGIYTLAYSVPESDGFDNCYYRIICAGTSLDTEVIVSQNSTGGEWARLLPDLNLSGDVQVILDNRGRGGQTVGTRMSADAIGLFTSDAATPVNPDDWSLYE